MADLTSLRKNSRKQARRANKKVAPVASDARETVVRAAGTSYDWAAPKVETAKDWAAPKVGATKDWAAPRVGTAKDWAAPHVETAKDWAAPHVETAALKVKDDLVPKVAEAVVAAFAATEPTREEAKSRGTAAIAALRGEIAPPPSRRRRRFKRFFLLVTVSGAAIAGWKVWSSKNAASRPDPWVTAESESTYSPPSPVAAVATEPIAAVATEPVDDDATDPIADIASDPIADATDAAEESDGEPKPE
jgi:Family of unknown function (DUF5324)